MLKRLKKQVVIGSTIDPRNGAGNPYGLTISPITAGKLTKGDLVVCNFNAKSNKQGTGRPIVAFIPWRARPRYTCRQTRRSSAAMLWHLTAAAGSGPPPWSRTITQFFHQAASSSPTSKASLSTSRGGKSTAIPNTELRRFTTNAGTGTVVRINRARKFTYDVIASGFPVNHGVPGTALAPSGLAYDASIDTLYFADGENNTVVAIKNVSKVPKGGIKAKKHGMKFMGPSAKDARIVFAGKPLNGPISTALLPNGNLVVGNTLDPDGKNLMIELSVSGKLLDVRNVDRVRGCALRPGGHRLKTLKYENLLQRRQRQ